MLLCRYVVIRTYYYTSWFKVIYDTRKVFDIMSEWSVVEMSVNETSVGQATAPRLTPATCRLDNGWLACHDRDIYPYFFQTWIPFK